MTTTVAFVVLVLLVMGWIWRTPDVVITKTTY